MYSSVLLQKKVGCIANDVSCYVAGKNTWIELSIDAFEHNIRTYKNITGNNSALAVVVKSNAYGHGIEQIAFLCQENPNVTWLCLSTLSEALHLRAIGVTKPLLVFYFLDADIEQAIEKSIDLAVYDLDTITYLNGVGKKVGKAVSVHIKIDTGMSRFGFYPSEIQKVLEHIRLLPYVHINGVYTHFAESEQEDQKFTIYQQQQFNNVLGMLKKMGIHVPHRHTSNTAAATLFDNAGVNFVRLGAGAYGLSPSDFVHSKTKERYPAFSLKQVMTWKTYIVHIRTIPANQSIGYGRTYKTKKQTTIALLPIGYFDGYDRRCSNAVQVVVVKKRDGIIDLRKSYAPLVGRVSMNVTAIDISHMEGVEIGDEVILLGDYPKIRAYDIAKQIGSMNPREVTTRINPVIARTVSR